MAITNITGQKPKPIVEVSTLDAALSKKIASANIQRKALIEAIKDILLQYKTNFNLESDERNVKIVDCIMKRHKALLDNMLSKDINVQNIMSALDLNVEDWLSRFYLLSKPGTGPDDVRTIKEDIIECILDALKKYSGKEIEALTSTVETTVIDKNENIDNFDALNNYFMNIQTFMKDQYKSKLTTLKTIDKVEKVEQKNLIKKLSVVTKTSKAGIAFSSIKSKLNIFKSNLTAKFNKPITLNDRQPKKNLNPFRLFDFNKRIGLNKSLKKGLKKVLDISGITVVKDVVGKIAKSLLNKMKPLINKVKSVINKIKGIIIGFMLSLIPFVGPIIKVVKFVLKPILFTLKIAFKLLSFAVKFIGKTIGLIFTGVFKLMKFTIKGVTKTIGFLTKGIYKILKSNIVKKLVAFMLTPTGAFITGFIVGMIYVKLWKPFKEKYLEIKEKYFGHKENSKSLKQRFFDLKDSLLNKYDYLKDTITSWIDKVYKFVLDINPKTLKQSWIDFQINHIQPIKNKFAPFKYIIKMLTEFFSGDPGRAIGTGIGFAVGMALSSVATAALAPIVGPFAPVLGASIGSLIGWGLSKFLGGENDTDGRSDRDELEERKQNLLQLYGPNSLKKQETYENLIEASTTNGISEDTKNAIRQKQEIYRQIGITTSEEYDEVDKLKKQVNEEISICSNNAKYTIDDVKNNKDGILEGAYNTKIPFSVERNGEGKVVKVADTLEIPDQYNPYGFRLIRAKLIDDQIDRFYKGLITYDQLMEFKNSIVEKDDKGMHINKEILESEQKSSGLDLQSVMTNNESGSTWKSLWLNKNSVEKMDKWLNSTASAEKAQQEYQVKMSRINNILNGLAKTGAFSHIPKDKLPEILENFRQYLLKQDIDVFEKMSSNDKAKLLMDIYDKISKDTEKLINDDLQKKQDAEDKKELDSANAELKRLETESANEYQLPNEQTSEAIQKTPMPTDKIKTEDIKEQQQVQQQAESVDKTSDAKELDTNAKTEKEVGNTQEKLRNISEKMEMQITRLSIKQNNASILPSNKSVNPAAEEANRIMKEQID